MNRADYQPARFLDSTLIWRPLGRQTVPASVRDWLADQGSLTRRLQAQGAFRVQPLWQGIARPTAAEAAVLGLPMRRQALVREVLLQVDGAARVYARSVLPLSSLRGRNRVLGHMAGRSLGAELFRVPRARREAVRVAAVPASRLPVKGADQASACWGRQSLFRKRGQPLLVAEIFLFLPV